MMDMESLKVIENHTSNGAVKILVGEILSPEGVLLYGVDKRFQSLVDRLAKLKSLGAIDLGKLAGLVAVNNDSKLEKIERAQQARKLHVVVAAKDTESARLVGMKRKVMRGELLKPQEVAFLDAEIARTGASKDIHELMVDRLEDEDGEIESLEHLGQEAQKARHEGRLKRREEFLDRFQKDKSEKIDTLALPEKKDCPGERKIDKRKEKLLGSKKVMRCPVRAPTKGRPHKAVNIRTGEIYVWDEGKRCWITVGGPSIPVPVEENEHEVQDELVRVEHETLVETPPDTFLSKDSLEELMADFDKGESNE